MKTDKRLVELTENVTALLKTEKPTPDMMYALLLSGYKVYKSGLGIPHDVVYDAICEAYRNLGIPTEN